MSGIDVRAASRMWTPDAGLRPVTFTVGPGELAVVRGRSGSGKSTLLALLAGVIAPDTGAVLVDGASPFADMPWVRLAFVPQVLALSIELSVCENVADVDRALAAAQVDEVLERLDLTALAARGVDEISMGQRQRVAVARAVVARPAVLLVDEPTSYQDGRHAEAVIAELRHAADAGAAVLAATHDPEVVAAADHVVELTG